jgi:hypothetical protein
MTWVAISNAPLQGDKCQMDKTILAVIVTIAFACHSENSFSIGLLVVPFCVFCGKLPRRQLLQK